MCDSFCNAAVTTITLLPPLFEDLKTSARALTLILRLLDTISFLGNSAVLILKWGEQSPPCRLRARNGKTALNFPFLLCSVCGTRAQNCGRALSGGIPAVASRRARTVGCPYLAHSSHVNQNLRLTKHPPPPSRPCGIRNNPA